MAMYARCMFKGGARKYDSSASAISATLCRLLCLFVMPHLTAAQGLPQLAARQQPAAGLSDHQETGASSGTVHAEVAAALSLPAAMYGTTC